MIHPVSSSSAVIEERYVDAAGIRTRYFEAGEGPVVVLLHGASLAIDAWSTWYRALPVLAKNFRVVAPDLVGFGLSDVAADGRQVSRLERRHHALAFIKALEIEKCALVGHSEGGFIAALLAIEHPNLVEKIVIVTSGATSPRLGGDLDTAWNEAAARAYNVADGCDTEEDFLRTNSVLSTTNPPDLIEILRANYNIARERGQLERFKTAERDGGYMDYTQIQEDHVLPFLKDAPARVLIAWATHDETVPVARGIKLLERVPEADMHIFGNAAHMVMIDRSDEFNSILAAWLA